MDCCNIVTYICYMINNKHKNATEDYTKAYSIVNGMSVYGSDIVKTSNKKAFRKYVSELSKLAGNKFATRSVNDSTLSITRIE